MLDTTLSSLPLETLAAQGPAARDELRIAFERAQVHSRELVALAVRVDRFAAASKRAASDVRAQLGGLVRKAVDPGSGPVHCESTEEGLLVLVDGISAERGRELAQRVVCAARALRSGSSKAGATVSIGIAHNRQRDPIFFETLCEVAWRGAEVAASGGGDRWAQTEIYRLVQRRLDKHGAAAAERARVHARAGLELEAAPPASAAPAAPPARSFTPPVPPAPAARPAAAGPTPEEIAAATERALVEERKRLRVEFEQTAVRDIRALEAARASEHQAEIQRLERRIEKMAKELEEAEGRIVRLSKMKVGDAGVASIYRTVQGLDEEDSQRELKRELLETVFISNRQLLDMIASRR